jgi:hypothetical protein
MLFPLPLALPCLNAPIARSEARRLIERRRELRRFGSRRGSHKRRLRPIRSPPRGRNWRKARRLARRVGGFRSQARIRSRERRCRRIRFRGLRPDRNGAGHEIDHQLVHAGLAAQVLCLRTRAVTRTPSAEPQLRTLLIGHKPVVRLALFRPANVARDCLPDHRRPRPQLSMACHGRRLCTDSYWRAHFGDMHRGPPEPACSSFIGLEGK